MPQVVPFLKGSGARGFFADEEEQLLRKREDAEMQAREQLEKERDQFEKEARKNQRGLCAATQLVHLFTCCMDLICRSCWHVC